MKGIKKIGFEIEGGFSKAVRVALAKFGEFANDSTVNNYLAIDGFKGEFRSRPYSKVETAEKIIECLPSIVPAHIGGRDGLLGSGYSFDSSCGFHIHLSFYPDVLPVIMSMRFQKYFINRLSSAFPDVVVRRANNHYCRIKKKLSNKCIYKQYNRYLAINYACALEKHGTIEFRIFPADTSDKMIAYLRFVVGCVNDFIALPFPSLRVSVKRAVCTPITKREVLSIRNIKPIEILAYV